jgi:hypothetical protein
MNYARKRHFGVVADKPAEPGYTLVDNKSILAHTLRVNAERLKMTFALEPGVPGFLKVVTPIVDACLASLDEAERPLQSAFVDLATFKSKTITPEDAMGASKEKVK